jgi:Mg2+-importing ATPase
MDGAAPNSANVFWADDEAGLLESLDSSPGGLSSAEADRRRSGRAESAHRRRTQLVLMLRQFTTPITLILIVATLLSAALGETVDAGIILAIVIPSGLLSFSQEYSASRAM